jgi:hypothetical protein
MSDDNYASPNTFFKYFSAETMWLLCIWHVLHNWALNAKKLISDKAFQKRVMCNLSMLAQLVH